LSNVSDLEAIIGTWRVTENALIHNRWRVFMPKIDENTKCHFFKLNCYYPYTEDEIKQFLEEANEKDTIYAIPQRWNTECTNCLIAQILDHFPVKI
jgi:hypothetical protein